MASAYVGYALLVTGIAILMLTMLVGYGQYQTVVSGGNSYQQQKVSGGNITQVVGSALGNISSSANSSIYMIISVILLFLFANIGYKISFLGIKMLNREEGKG